MFNYDKAYDEIRSLENMGVLTHSEAKEKIKQLARRRASDIGYDEDEFYTDQFQIHSEDVPSDLNYEQRAEWYMEMQYMGYHF